MANANNTAHLSGAEKQRIAQAALVAGADDLPAPPAAFDPDAQYRVRLNRVVPGPAPLRPNSVVQVMGSYAETIRDAISGAKKVD